MVSSRSETGCSFCETLEPIERIRRGKNRSEYKETRGLYRQKAEIGKDPTRCDSARLAQGMMLAFRDWDSWLLVKDPCNPVKS